MFFECIKGFNGKLNQKAEKFGKKLFKSAL